METEEKAVKLLIHLDVNKTIMIKDSVKLDGSTERILQNILSICAWGLFNSADKSWKLATVKLYTPLDEGEQPLLINTGEESMIYGTPKIQDCELLTQEDVSLILKSEESLDRKVTDIAQFLTFKDYMLKIIKRGKKRILKIENKRGKLLSQFIRDDAVYATELKPLFEELVDSLKVKDSISPDHKLYKYLNNYYSIIPSFFHLYKYLTAQKFVCGRKLEFKIIFRTFGKDHQTIHEEFEEFIIGNHPIFKNDFPPEKICEQKYSNCGNFLRSKTNKEDILLITGLCPNSELLSKISDDIFAPDKTYDEIISMIIKLFDENNYQDFNSEVLKVRRGVTEIREYLLSCNDHFSCIQDDHAAWHFNDMSVTFAKPLIIDPSADIVEIMFDDHCSFGDDCIINVIDALSGNSIDYKDHINKFTIKANPIQALRNNNYFIDIVEALLKVQKDKIVEFSKDHL